MNVGDIFIFKDILDSPEILHYKILNIEANKIYILNIEHSSELVFDSEVIKNNAVFIDDIKYRKLLIKFKGVRKLIDKFSCDICGERLTLDTYYYVHNDFAEYVNADKQGTKEFLDSIDFVPNDLDLSEKILLCQDCHNDTYYPFIKNFESE